MVSMFITVDPSSNFQVQVSIVVGFIVEVFIKFAFTPKQISWAEKLGVGFGLTAITALIVSEQPFPETTINSTILFPVEPYEWLGLNNVDELPSPKSHVDSAMPLLSVDKFVKIAEIFGQNG